MQNTVIWNIVPTNQPTVLRNCPKCGIHSEYVCSGNFRVNANQSLLDVWLIYQCKKCNNTWNMEILSRVPASSIDKELYSKFLSNDADLARKYAFDIGLHTKNKSVLSYDNISYEIMEEIISGDEKSNDAVSNASARNNLLKQNATIQILSEYPLDIRLDRILSLQFGISREQVKKLGKSGRIIGDGAKDITKAKIKNNMLITIT